MNTDKPIDVSAEVQPQTQAVAIREQGGAVAPANLFGAADAVAVVQKATAVATALRGVIEQQKLISTISGKQYPKCEAWTLLGTMLGVFPVLQWTKQLPNGWEARVEARTRDGCVVGAAEAECLRTEKNWSNRDDFALRSMAQTRATAKALRMPLGFVMTLSGYEPTPAEEMAMDHPREPARNAPQRFTPTQDTPKPPAATPSPKPVAAQPICATEQQHAKLVQALAPQRELAERYFRAINWLLPTETLESLMLGYVPATKKQFELLIAQLDAVARGEEPIQPYAPNEEPLAPPRKKSEKAPEPAEPAEPAPVIDPSWQVVEGIVSQTSLKEGKKKDGTGWSLWGIKIGEDWHNTFSNRVGQAAQAAKASKKPVKLYYTLDNDNRREAQEIIQ